MDVSGVPHLHSLTDWSPDGRRGVENVNGIHLSECRVTIRAHQKNQILRWQWIKPMRIQAPHQLGLGARALAHVNNHQPLCQINLAQQISPVWHSEMLAHPNFIGRHRWWETCHKVPRATDTDTRPPDPCEAWGQTLQLRQWTQADDPGLRFSHRTPRKLDTLSSTAGYL